MRGAAALVFISSGAVLVLEILGIRLLAPYVGLTIETTTVIIGTVLAGIAAGAAIGGRAADELDPRRLLAGLLAAGGALAIATVPIARGLGSALQDDATAAATLIAAAALFPPAAVLSAVTPTVARVQLRDLSTTGTVVGRLSAWATAGGLVGTFATGFVIVPLLPTDVAVVAVGVVLVVLGLVVARTGAALAAGAAAVVMGAATLAAGAPCDAETVYHCARVEEDGSGRVLRLERLRHSYVDLQNPTTSSSTTRAGWATRSTTWPGAARGRVHRRRRVHAAAVHRGHAARLALARARGRRATWSTARERLGLRTGPDLRVRVGDARVTLRGEPTDSADLVVGDAFGGVAVPWHLTTEEFARDIRRVLRPDGLYLLNVIDYGPRSLARAEEATLREVFENVALVGHPDPGGNHVFLASDAPLSELPARALDLPGGDVLRDDDAPADQLLTPAA